MELIRCIFINTLLLYFPIFIYLIYIAYIKNTEDNNLLYVCLEISLIFILVYQVSSSNYLSIISFIPLLIFYLLDNKFLYIINTIILFIFYKLFTNISIYILLIEYIGYLIINYIKRDDLKFNCLIWMKVLIYSIVLCIYRKIKYNIIVIFIEVLIFIIKWLIEKSYTLKALDTIIDQSNKDKLLYRSLSRLTHELKNPIAVCKGYLDMIDKKGINKTDKYLPIISGEINRSLDVINDFNLLSKAKKLNKEEVDLYLLLEEVVDSFKPLFIKNNDELIYYAKDEELYLYIDYNKIKQVLINIIKNSLEAKCNRMLIVKIKTRKLKNYVKITIEDNGCGIKEENMERIKEIFYTTKDNGNGIGVNLIYEIIDLHKGKIKYKSEVNKGTIVEIELPYK